VVIRDSDSDVLASLPLNMRGTMEVRVAERFGVKWAITGTKEMGFHGGIFDTDKHRSCSSFQQNERALTYLQRVIQDAQMASRGLKYFSSNHVKRSADRLVHNLAKAALCIDGLGA